MKNQNPLAARASETPIGYLIVHKESGAEKFQRGEPFLLAPEAHTVTPLYASPSARNDNGA